MLSSIRQAYVELKKQPTKLKLDYFFELVVCRIEDMQDQIEFLQSESKIDEKIEKLNAEHTQTKDSVAQASPV